MPNSWGSKDARIHIVNQLNSDLYVLVTPSSAWAWADFGGTVLQTVALGIVTAASGGAAAPAAAAAAAELGTIARTIKAVKDLYNFLMSYSAFRVALRAGKAYLDIEATRQNVGTAIGSLTPEMNDAVQKLREFLDGKAVIVPAKSTVRVNDENYLKAWRAINPSYWAALSNANTAHLLIVDKNLERFTSFDSGADDSYIVNAKGVVRSQYGHLEEPVEAEYREWPNRAHVARLEGVWADGIDAGFSWGDKAYFFKFKTGQYVEYDIPAASVIGSIEQKIAAQEAKGSKIKALDNGYVEVTDYRGGKMKWQLKGEYPKSITEGWPGLPWNDRFQVFAYKDVAYFFRDAEYVRYELRSKTVSPGFPKPIAGSWAGDFRVGGCFKLPGDDVVIITQEGDAFVYDMANDRIKDGPRRRIDMFPGMWDVVDGYFVDGRKIYLFHMAAVQVMDAGTRRVGEIFRINGSATE